jgi:hypothetical protein
LYASVGVAGTLMLVQIWTTIGAQFTIVEARRLFGFIAGAGAIGAMVGLGLARHIVRERSAWSLVALAGAALTLASGLPLLLRNWTSSTPAASPQAPLGRMARTEYARRIFWMVALTTITTTAGDFVFKSSVAATVSREGLGSFFATYQLGMSGVGLAMQLVVAPLLLRRVGANRTILALPLVSLATALAFVFMPGISAGLALKSADAALRNSVHRTSTEVLYLPLPFAIRGRLKAIADGIGQRGAQALASLLVLGGLAVGATSVHVAAAVAVAAAGALFMAAGLRRHYVDAFRDQVREGALNDNTKMGELDLHSVESLLAMLSSPKDQRVLAALETLATQGKNRLIPSLLVYHPSSDVAMRALAILAASGRRDFLPLTERLVASPSTRLAGAAATVRAMLVASEAELRSYAADERATVRAIGLVALVRKRAANWADWNAVDRITQRGSREDRLELLGAIARMPEPRLEATVARLAKSDDPAVQLAAVRALQASGDRSGLPLALRLLGVRETREGARQIFLTAGPSGIELLGRALVDPTIEPDVRHHIPRTLSRFANQRAAVILLDGLMRAELDGVTRYKILRGLGRMKRNQPSLQLDRKKLRTLAQKAIERTRELRRWRASLGQLPSTSLGMLLKGLLARKERMAVERLFRALDLLRPGAELAHIHHGLSHPDAERRAASRELLEYLADPALRHDVLALVDGEAASEDDVPPPPAEAIAAMRADHSSALRALADEFAPELATKEAPLYAHQHQ